MAAAAPLAQGHLGLPCPRRPDRRPRPARQPPVGGHPPPAHAAGRAGPGHGRLQARPTVRPALQPRRLAALPDPVHPMGERPATRPGRRHRRPDHRRLPLRPAGGHHPRPDQGQARRRLHAGQPRLQRPRQVEPHRGATARGLPGQVFGRSRAAVPAEPGAAHRATGRVSAAHAGGAGRRVDGPPRCRPRLARRRTGRADRLPEPQPGERPRAAGLPVAVDAQRPTRTAGRWPPASLAARSTPRGSATTRTGTTPWRGDICTSTGASVTASACWSGAAQR